MYQATSSSLDRLGTVIFICIAYFWYKILALIEDTIKYYHRGFAQVWWHWKAERWTEKEGWKNHRQDLVVGCTFSRSGIRLATAGVGLYRDIGLFNALLGLGMRANRQLIIFVVMVWHASHFVSGMEL
jgi:hypothetical protein